VKTAQKRAEQRRLLRKQRQEQERNQVAAEMEFHHSPEVVQEIGFDDGDEDQFGADFDFGGGDEDHDNPLETNTGITLVDEAYPNRELGTLYIL
jgi:hypothetical protein